MDGRFARPTGDFQQNQQRPPPPPPPGGWYSGPQFQYQQPSPNFPPTNPNWGDHQSSYPSPHFPPPPYPAPHHHYPPPPPPHHLNPNPNPHLPPPPPQQQQQQPYPHPNQSWDNPNWPRHQGWEHPGRNIPHNEEDWAARARAWAAAKDAMENQYTHSQFTPVDRREEHVYHDHYQQPVDSRFTDIQHSSLPPLSHQQLPISVANPHRPPLNHLQESTSFSSGESSFYASDGTTSYTARDGAFAVDTNSIPPHGNVVTSSSVYQQEVPSSYSSIPGSEESGNQNEQLRMPLPLPISSHQEGQHHSHPPTLPAIGRPISVDQRPHFDHGDLSTEPINIASDQSLDFGHGSVHNDPHQVMKYTHPDHAAPVGGPDHFAAANSVNAWTPATAQGVVFPSIPPVPSVPQFDPSFITPSLPGHPAPIFGRVPGPSFRPTIPPVGAPFGLGTGTALHPTTPFSDTNGIFNLSERPKKASVPNWLREEIIKNRAIVSSSSAPDHLVEYSSHSIGDESVDKSFRKADHADSKSIDSNKSTEDEDDDEDDVEAARSAAINQEIKRILTEVLLKVTDELFEEIATKVVSEDDLMVQVDDSSLAANNKSSSSPPAIPTPKASAKVLIPVKAKDAEVAAAADKSSSSSPGDVLGLANYASDDDDNEVQSSNLLSTRQNSASDDQRLSSDMISEHILKTVKKGNSRAEIQEPIGTGMDGDDNSTGPSGAMENHHAMDSSVPNMTVKASPRLDNELDSYSAGASAAFGDRNSDDQVSFEGEKSDTKPQAASGGVIIEKPITNDPRGREGRNISEKKDGHKGKKSPIHRDLIKVGDGVKAKADQRHCDSVDSRRGADREVRKEKTDERNSVKEKMKDQDAKPAEKSKESDSRSHVGIKDGRKEIEKLRRVDGKEDSSNKKRERERDDKGDLSRHRGIRDSSRYKRQHSSSVSRGRNSRDSDSSDEVSENSRKKRVQSGRRSLSPSPIRSRRRRRSRSRSRRA
ncbi:cyclin-like protein isoform X2 [Tasmannia lanceolata]|uniref:cyclin-like protein isoform X2 n=1 Tax=Tasmannia lanceolata TaxID=3420 RepID=UPI004062EBC6